MKMKIHILTIFLSLSTVLSYSQKADYQKANKAYDNFSYAKTSDILLEVANNGYTSVALLKKLANSLYFNNEMEEAAKWYGKLFEDFGDTDLDSEYYFRYAQALKATESYEESDAWMQKFHEANKDDLRGKAFVNKKNYLESILSASQNLEIVNLDLNTEKSDFGTNQYKDKLVFASSRLGKKIYKWNKQPYLDLYTATKQTDGSYKDVRAFNEDINTKYHESTAAFTPDDEFMYFTRNNFYKNHYNKDDQGINRLKIFKATKLTNGDWGNVESIPFNSNDYSVAHPTINVQGTKMYFASDMPGTLGQSDLYEVDILEDGTLGEPINLGGYLNTEAQETFPFINENGDLYYSSNGRAGLGGLDVYLVRDFENKRKSEKPLIIENIGKPINSPKDDFGYYENLGTKEGFFTSNRDGGKGDDDIYSFKVVECEQIVKGIVLDKNTQELLAEAKVTLYSKSEDKIETVITDQAGAYSFSMLTCNEPFLIRVEKTGYIGDEKNFVALTGEENQIIDLNLEADMQAITPCADLAKILDIPVVYFDFDKYNIRYDAEVDLQKVLVLMNQYPTLKIDIRSHTDCRGTEAYNETLSSNRAKSTKNYLISKGIDASRLTAKGYGESQLLNHCECDSNNQSTCTEEEHNKNRRSEFIVTSINGKSCLDK
jgi:outer membrane protein OmpA-like peptidoglycan-associated protein/tetratricopeptide (TPR) repeat protein